MKLISIHHALGEPIVAIVSDLPMDTLELIDNDNKAARDKVYKSDAKKLADFIDNLPSGTVREFIKIANRRFKNVV